MTARPSPPVDDLRLVFAGQGRNADAYLGAGWRPAEAEFRWTDGAHSELRLPAMRARPWFVLTLDAYPFNGKTQPLTVRLNGAEVARYAHQSGVPYDIVVPGDLVSAEAENRLDIDLAQPSQAAPGSTDKRALGLALRQLILTPLDAPPHATPLPLPEPPHPADWWEARAVSEAFQSLGQHCDLGLFQRRYGAEPFGLLRFASIFPAQLIRGLRTRFAGVGDPKALSFFMTEDGGQWDGKHAVYGLNYHTFKMAADTDASTLAVKEAARLNYLARLLFEQLENNERIFLRVENFEPDGEALALHRQLQSFHPQARLLLLQVAPADAPERIGRVYELRPGLYRGYLSRRSDIANTREPRMYDEWLKLCTTVVAYETARAQPDDPAQGAVGSAETDAPARRAGPKSRTQGPGAAVDSVRLIFAGEGQNVAANLGEGWHAAEPAFRWTEGASSALRLPAMRARPWFVLRLDALTVGGVPQPLTIRLNGAQAMSYAHQPLVPFDIVIPGDLVSAVSWNHLVIDHPLTTRPSDANPESNDKRLLALAFRQLSLEALDAPLNLAPRLLPEVAAPADPAQAKAVCEAFQSLGQNCDLGLVQRHYGCEPFGLLRFARTLPHQLIQGLQTRFVGVGDLDKLSFYLTEDGSQWDGRHAVYGLHYHTFKKAADTDASTLALKEAARLDYLARLLFEQLENNEKIFVREGNFEAPGEALALHRLLRTFHPQARLLILQAAPADAPERIGRVNELRPGLYCGHLSRRSDIITREPSMYDEWLKLCATVVADETARSGHEHGPQPPALGGATEPSGAAQGQSAASPPPVDGLSLIFAGEGQNVEPYLGEGWHPAEPEFRWTDGLRSVLRLPPLRPQAWFALTLQGWALDLGGAVQTFNVVLNGACLRNLRLSAGVPTAIAVPGDLMRAERENTIVLDHPGAVRPSEAQPGNGDVRLLSAAFRRIDVEPLDEPLSLAPRLLPEAAPEQDEAETKAVAQMFQSLGQGSAVGGFQRRYGAEPDGWLSFASLFPLALIEGLRTRFAGVGDVDKLSFYTPAGGRELYVRHAVYGLDCPAVEAADDADVAALARRQAQRLEDLARAFFEQLEKDEKIFLRTEHFETPEEALALHRVLRSYNPRARLLLLHAAPAHSPELTGRVVELRPGLYRGYPPSASDPDPVLFEAWMRLCATVVAYERA